MRAFPSERLLGNAPEGTPVPDSKAELPPVIRRAEVVAFALVALLVIVVVAVLYLARAFRSRWPSLSAPCCAGGEPARTLPDPRARRRADRDRGRRRGRLHGRRSPRRSWSGARGAEPGAMLKARVDRPLALWQSTKWSAAPTRATLAAEIRMGAADAGVLSPTFAEFLLFIAT